MIRLNSVGSALDPNSLLIHPVKSNGDVDLSEGSAVSLYDLETEDDWMSQLSFIDSLIVSRALGESA
tara:strand:+ start:197 stop:397 length:201 start_codon:yes stop_codon:yes gene_type:complete